MALPKVDFTIQNGNLGGLLATGDNVVGIILANHTAAPSGMTLGVAERYTSLEAVKADGLDADFDTTNSTNAYEQVKEIYDIETNAVVWIMFVANTVTMTEICDKAETVPYLKNLVEQSGYEVKVVGICKNKASVAVTKGIDDDVIAAIAKAQAYADDLEAAGSPVAFVIEGRDYQGTAASLEAINSGTDDNSVAVVIGSVSATDNSAAVGLLLGKCATNPVQRNPGRVKDGALPIDNAYLSDGTAVDDIEDDIETIHDKGYITIRKYRTRSGYYFTDDPLATVITDDINNLARRRVLNKAIRIAYDTYVAEINEEIPVTAAGKVDPGFAKYFQEQVQNQLDALMTANANISEAGVYVDVDQDVIATNTLAVQISLTPVAYAKTINVTIGFTNPAN